MSAIKALAIRHPLLFYLSITFAIAWGGGLLAIGGSGGMAGTTPGSDPRFVYALIGLAGPEVQVYSFVLAGIMWMVVAAVRLGDAAHLVRRGRPALLW